MENNIDEILKDLYALDPTLKERNLDVRAFITAFANQKPVIAIDANFVKNLRAQLVPSKIVSPYQITHDWNWWMFRLLPVGATLLLILMLIPDLQNSQTLTPTTTQIQETSLYSEDAAPATLEAPAGKRAGGQAENFSLMMDSRMAVPSDSFTLGEQVPGDVAIVAYATLLQEGFITIHTEVAGEPGELLGVSSLLPTGPTERVLVPLSTNLVAGGSYIATLYYDDGDGVFMEQTDTLVIESNSGLILRAPFTVSTVTPAGEGDKSLSQ